MRLDLIRRAKGNVHAAAVGLPSGDAGGEMLVGISDAAVVLFFVFVLFGVGGGIAAQPELLDELVALFVVGELHEGRALFIGDDVAHVLVEPLLVSLLQLTMQRLFIGAALLFRKRL